MALSKKYVHSLLLYIYMYITGKCKRRYLKIINERSDDVILTIDKTPANFTLSTSEQTELSIPAESHVSH